MYEITCCRTALAAWEIRAVNRQNVAALNVMRSALHCDGVGLNEQKVQIRGKLEDATKPGFIEIYVDRVYGGSAPPEGQRRSVYCQDRGRIDPSPDLASAPGQAPDEEEGLCKRVSFESMQSVLGSRLGAFIGALAEAKAAVETARHGKRFRFLIEHDGFYAYHERTARQTLARLINERKLSCPRYYEVAHGLLEALAEHNTLLRYIRFHKTESGILRGLIRDAEEKNKRRIF